MHLKRSYRKNEQMRMFLVIIPFFWYSQSVGTAHQKHSPLFQINVLFSVMYIIGYT